MMLTAIPLEFSTTSFFTDLSTIFNSVFDLITGNVALLIIIIAGIGLPILAAVVRMFR